MGIAKVWRISSFGRAAKIFSAVVNIVINLTLKVINIIIYKYFFQIDLPVAWLSLDEASKRLPRILTHLAATVQRLFD